MSEPAIPTPFFRCLAADLRLLCREKNTFPRRLFAFLTNRGFQAIFLYRLARQFLKAHIPLVPLILSRLAQFLYAIDISPHAQLGPGIVIVHGFGVVIGAETRIHGDCCIYHGVTFGDRGSEWTGSQIPDGHPTVEPACMFGAGAKILGPITIGRNCVIGANAVVNHTLPANSIAAGIPAKVIGTRPEMDEHLRPINRVVTPKTDSTPKQTAGAA
jgi:serine O-acetyltransferase